MGKKKLVVSEKFAKELFASVEDQGSEDEYIMYTDDEGDFYLGDNESRTIAIYKLERVAKLTNVVKREIK